ncbi:hypothetical protein GCE9029_01606 [Grimontia celer]|uniref:DUF2474 domain-containing protein n=1 Tax=Grimontia celer TaxID=1796497 RepID=A0A128EYQ8_9GAMM|nr:DUF2474 family protein [Grimontia celer]CZF79703.1 hypothetical protein GCE9029_01606 [Grimontia celer]
MNKQGKAFAWFVGLWFAGVFAVTALAYFIRYTMQWVGLV